MSDKSPIDRLQRVVEASTPKPWHVDQAIFVGGGQLHGKESRAIYHMASRHHCVEVVESPDDEHGECIHNEKDATFIAVSRNCFEELIAVARAASVLCIKGCDCDICSALANLDKAIEKEIP